jgi:predicted DsbA family dithiol-disulfide isomerase
MIIQVFADVVCPWCYIGHERLRQALRLHAKAGRLADSDITLEWMPFQLNPDMPQGGMDRETYLTAKFGSADRARATYAVVAAAARHDGLPLLLDKIRTTPNTLDAHRLVRWARQEGKALAMIERLFAAYFQEGRDIGDTATLTLLAHEVGLDRREARAFLMSGLESEAVRTSDAMARRLGVQAVPCFVFGRRYALAGAQEPAAFFPLLDLALLDHQPQTEAEFVTMAGA